MYVINFCVVDNIPSGVSFILNHTHCLSAS